MTERLPEDGAEVWVTTEMLSEVTRARWHKNTNLWCHPYNTDCLLVLSPIAWMPMMYQNRGKERVMARYIDADRITLPQGFFEKVDNVPKFYEWLSNIPTADVVEVVRCKDCKHFGYYKTSFTASFTNVPIPGCFKEGIKRWREVKENGFCDMGERRE